MGRIENINSKFNWSKHHFELLNAETTKYLQVNPCKFVSKGKVTTDENGRGWTNGTFEAVEPIPEPLSLILGDCLANLRSSLDFLVWELVGANGKKATVANAFPVAHTIDTYREEINRGRLKNVDPAAIAIIEGVQPYHISPAEETFLAVLNKLTNINKHRRLLLTTLKTIAPIPNMQMVGGQAYAVVDPPTIQGNAEFGPFEVFGDEVKVEADLMSYVAFNEAPVTGFGVYGMVEAISRFVDTRILGPLEPFL
jgi:hypothetical protein